ncbi:MAG: hypothetical protein LBQ91_03600 [Oscillospiraceae bacterium]|nr:hypothetical protein [Oscillospiraceae bacterium]
MTVYNEHFIVFSIAAVNVPASKAAARALFLTCTLWFPVLYTLTIAPLTRVSFIPPLLPVGVSDLIFSPFFNNSVLTSSNVIAKKILFVNKLYI